MGVQDDSGELDVRVVLHVRVDPKAWAENMIGDHPAEVGRRDVTRSVKAFVAEEVARLGQLRSNHSEIDTIPIHSVTQEA